jgi:hypothetical protein
MAKIEIYVVTTLNPSERQLTAIKESIAEKYGGLSIIRNVEGLWFNPKTQKLDTDKVEIWRIVTNDIDAKFINDVAFSLKIVCGQTCQLYTIDDKPFFLEGKVQYCRVSGEYINPKNCIGCTMC